MKSVYARKQVELFLAEEERSIEKDSEQEEDEIEGDGYNTPTQRKLGLDISMIGGMILPVVSLFLGRSNNSMRQTSQLKMQQSKRKHSGASDNSLTTIANAK